MKTNAYKKLISLILALVLVISASAFAFADTEESSSVSVEDSRDQVFLEVARQVASTSSNYTVDDVYNLLIQCAAIVNNQYVFRTFDTELNTLIRLYLPSITGNTSSISSDVDSILSNLSYNDGNNTYSLIGLLYNVSARLDNIYTELYSPVSSEPSLYMLIHDLLDNATSALIDANQNPYLYNIQSNQNTFSTLFNSFSVSCLNELRSISLDTALMSSNVSDISSNTANIVSNTNSLNNTLSDFKDDFNNINWNLVTDNYTIYDSDFNIMNTTSDVYNLSPGIYYIGFNWTNWQYENLYKLVLPIHYPNIGRLSDLSDYSVGYIQNNQFLQYNNYFSSYTANSFNNLSYNIFFASIPSNNNIYVKINIPNTVSVYASFNSEITGVYTLSNNQDDYYKVIEYIYNFNYMNIYEKFESLYASDDLIQAKENQQQLEDSVLEDFTGSGSASASVGDAVNIKGVQNSLKGSLNTGGVNASGLSTILNTSSPSSDTSFFKFWTQDVYNDINGVNNIPQTRSGNTYIFLNDSEELDRLIRSQSW